MIKYLIVSGLVLIALATLFIVIYRDMNKQLKNIVEKLDL